MTIPAPEVARLEIVDILEIAGKCTPGAVASGWFARIAVLCNPDSLATWRLTSATQ